MPIEVLAPAFSERVTTDADDCNSSGQLEAGADMPAFFGSFRPGFVSASTFCVNGAGIWITSRSVSLRSFLTTLTLSKDSSGCTSGLVRLGNEAFACFGVHGERRLTIPSQLFQIERILESKFCALK